MTHFNVPIAFMIFKRPEETALVFERIRQMRPQTLLVVADGARNSDEQAQVDATRAIISNVDWECDVRTNYTEHNMGLRERFHTGLNWVFEQVDRAIILEDDCVPDPTFFPYAQELLARYRDEERIMAIGGVNFHHRRYRPNTSYYFARYSRIWGWATWARAWQHYDPNMTYFANDPDGWITEHFENPREGAYYREVWGKVLSGEINTWDYQWSYSLIQRDGLSALPSQNLVTNVGWGDTATHTKKHTPLANVSTQPMSLPLKHPQRIERDRRAEVHLRRSQGIGMSIYERALRRMYRELGIVPYGE
jgi:hypothetical protein